MTYRMILQTTSIGLSWQYDFSAPSDDLATRSAQAHTSQFSGVPWFMSLLLFNVESDRFIARFTVAPPQIEVSST